MQKRGIQSVAVAMVFFLFSPLLAAKELNNLLVMGGRYTTKAEKTYPLLGVSSDQGETWTYPDTQSTLPADYNAEGEFYLDEAVQCNSRLCLGIVNYTNKDDHEHTKVLFNTSIDQGVSWSYKNTNNLSQKEELEVFWSVGVRCTTQMCMGAVNYVQPRIPPSLAIIHVPFLAVTKDGKTWSYPALPQNQSNDFLIKGQACSGESCFLYGDSSVDPEALLMVSTDQATTWSFASVEIPAPYKGASFNSIECNQNICLAAFDFSSATVQTKKLPALILKSSDKGKSWSAIPDLSIIDNNGTFPVISFVGEKTWILSGAKSCKGPDATHCEPRMFITRDDGVNWEEPATVSTNMPSGTEGWEYFINGVTCQGDFCSAGVTLSKDRMKPIFAMLLSEDRGKTWIYRDITPSDVTSDDIFNGLDLPICNEKKCIVGGFSIALSTAEGRLFVAASQDHWKTWHYPVHSASPSNLPTDYANGLAQLSSEVTANSKSLGLAAQLKRRLMKSAVPAL